MLFLVLGGDHCKIILSAPFLPTTSLPGLLLRDQPVAHIISVWSNRDYLTVISVWFAVGDLPCLCYGSPQSCLLLCRGPCMVIHIYLVSCFHFFMIQWWVWISSLCTLPRESLGKIARGGIVRGSSMFLIEMGTANLLFKGGGLYPFPLSAAGSEFLFPSHAC